MSRRPPWRAARWAVALVVATVVPVAVVVSPLGRPPHTPVATAPTTEPAPVPTPAPTPAAAAEPEWQHVFVDQFDGPAGTRPEQWHPMTSSNEAALNGQGGLEVGHVAQIRSTPGWTLPAGTRVRVSASLVMPDTGSNYAAFWVQHPNGVDPRELDVIESYGPLKPAGAQLGSHICYDEMVGAGADACEVSGMAPELWPVSQAFPAGAEPWSSYWEYSAEFTIGGDQVHYEARDGSGNQAYTVDSTPDPRRVPGNTVPFHLRLSNKDVEPEHMLPGGSRHSMFVDWVTVDVLYPTAAS